MAPDPPPADDPIASLIDDVADSWTHALSGVAGGFNGTYSVSDTLADIMECSIRASHTAAELLRGVGLLPPADPPHPNPTAITVDVPVDPARITPATAFACQDLRAIGFGEHYKIPAGPGGMVHVGAPAMSKNGLMTVPVTVSFANIGRFERHRTIVYEGTITAPPSANEPTPWTIVVRVPKPAQ